MAPERLSKDKEAAHLRAQQLFPNADLRRKRDHGRAEALLLAWGGRRLASSENRGMNGLCNTAPPLWTRGQGNTRVPGQRWCRRCLMHYQRQRRARQAAMPIIQAAIQAMPQVTSAPAPELSETQRQALEAYQCAFSDWQIRQQTRRQGWLPQDRTTILGQVARRLEHARQRLAALGIILEGVRGE